MVPGGSFQRFGSVDIVGQVKVRFQRKTVPVTLWPNERLTPVNILVPVTKFNIPVTLWFRGNVCEIGSFQRFGSIDIFGQVKFGFQQNSVPVTLWPQRTFCSSGDLAPVNILVPVT